MQKSTDKLERNAEYLLEAYNSVLKLLEKHKDSDGISRTSQSEIARILGVSQTAIAKRFKNLRKYGAIEKVGYKNAYIVHETSLFQNTPLGLTFKLAKLLEVRPELINDYYTQAELLDVSYRDIQIARGYLTFLTT